jgi:dinuclear metal center YbgI/SA1388 family protein
MGENGMKRGELVSYLDEYLQVRAIEDSSNNGLQVGGADQVTRLAFAVDASLVAFEAACAAAAQMLIVHHGLFWSKPIMVTGIHRRRLQTLLDAGLALYAAHLPLDYHEQVGNNVTLARWLKLEGVESFGDYQGHAAGTAGRLSQPCSLEQFAAQVEQSLGEPVLRVWPFGSETVQKVGIVSGGAGPLVSQAAGAGVDVYLTGEVSHVAYHQARELGVNVVFGGHYATETAGLKSLAEHLADRFGLETIFLDLSTGA